MSRSSRTAGADRALRVMLAALILLVAALATAGRAAAATYPAGFQEVTLAPSLSAPSGVAWTPDGRMLIIEREGRLKVVAPGTTTATTILDISARVAAFDDQGLLGIAVDSQYATNHFIYLAYTYDINPLFPDGSDPNVGRVSRFTLGTDNTVGPETPILGTRVSGPCPAPANTVDCIPVDHSEHTIGTVRSAPDGTLWIGSGDGANSAIVDPNALRTYNEQSLSGKIMHVDRSGLGLGSHPFCPSDTDLTHVCTKLFAKGLRNPYRFTLRPGGGGLALGDVGWNTYEEFELVPPVGGANFGWPCYEALHHTAGFSSRSECTAEYAKEGTAAADVPPDYEYTHVSQAAVVGGPEYTAAQYPAAYRGSIFLGDYATGDVRRALLDASGKVSSVVGFASGLAGPVDLEAGPTGNLVIVNFGTGAPGTGSVKEIRFTTGNTPPTAVANGTPSSGAPPLAVSFSSAGSSDADGDPLGYQWDFGDGSALSTAANPSHTYTAAGAYTAKLTVSDGRGATATATVPITVGNVRPVPTIEVPTAGSLYRDGGTISFRGSATDPQDGALPASALDWTVILVHIAHVHPVSEFHGVSSGQFTIRADHDADSHYEITLTATDSSGLTSSTTTSISPETVQMTLASQPAGASLTYAGRAVTAPFTAQSAIGFNTSISAANQLQSGGRLWSFDHWSDNGAQLHDITIPASAFTLTAVYKDAGPAGDPALVAAYAFDEASGTTVTDASGRANTGTITGATRTTGHSGSALTFNGTSNSVTIPDSSSLDLTSAMTLEAWVNPTIASDWRTVILKEATGNLAYSLYGASGYAGGAPSTWIGSTDLPGPAALPAGAWSHLATTWDGTTWRLYVDGVQKASRTFAGPIAVSSGALKIGGNALWGEYFSGRIDDVRIYNRGLTAAEVGRDRDTPVGGTAPPDTTPPTVSVTAPAAGATVSGASVALSATAADNVGVTDVQFRLDGTTNVGALDTTPPYAVAWNTTAVSTGAHTLTAVARDAAGNSATSTSVSVTVSNGTPDTTPPTVSMTAPARGATVSGASVALSATASDNVGVTGVQFRLDGTTNIGAQATTSPYAVTWNTTAVSNGAHTLTAVARDAAGNTTTSGAVSVTVSNAPPPPPGPGLVAAYGFEEASGATVTDRSGTGNTGTITGATRTTTGKFGSALSFNGSSNFVSVPDSTSLHLTTGMTLEAWVYQSINTDYRTVVIKEATGNLAYALYSASTYGTSAVHRPSSWLGSDDLGGVAALAADTWKHLATTYDGTTWRLYVDGAQVASKPFTKAIPTSTGPLKIGGNALWGEFFSGRIDEVRVYDHALTVAEIQADMNRAVG
ncbi:MAG TPA: LamG-like jellyroll fold domain-containing protein [Baekduia sp.]|nr:LamG-like jellyroll fold domain-containing protein [Baekduia sp.]